ncbi:052L [Cherax quadricarinatus iridovirus]|uniref:052L n=1 Tax=Cherax quadricarinatus iridovirus TaxID=2035708 RepID=UPI000BBF677F|nr:052L [Cherax quadricarinatus iridovirus]UPA43370.1 052L [Iridovirus CN01]ASZ85032.1 052L [Cherax quadricarinatus iridovirus]UPA43446.1 052L [Iridovirus CN01]UPA43640.1 052L [Iridovirus CN01]UPA43802.1 052L [Iridovirus CN01]
MNVYDKKTLSLLNKSVLDESDKLLNIFEYINAIKFNVDEIMSDKFWQSEYSPTINQEVLDWLGCENDSQLIEILNSKDIEFFQVDGGIVLSRSDFKEVVLNLGLDKINRYYLCTENLLKLYCEYTHHFQLKEKVREKKKQREQEAITNRYNVLLENKRLREQEQRRQHLEERRRFTELREQEIARDRERREREAQRERQERQREHEQRMMEMREAQIKRDRERREAQAQKEARMAEEEREWRARDGMWAQLNDRLQQQREERERSARIWVQNERSRELRDQKIKDKKEGKESFAKRLERRDGCTRVVKLAVVKMSPNYVWTKGDPEHYKNVNGIVINSRLNDFERQLNKIKNVGNGTNENASCIISFETSSNISLFEKLRESYSDSFDFEGGEGIRFKKRKDIVRAVNEIRDKINKFAISL